MEKLWFFKLILTKGFGDMKATEMIKKKRTWVSKMQMNINPQNEQWPGLCFNESERYAYN